MSLVRIGDIVIGSIHIAAAASPSGVEYIAKRVGGDGHILVGTAPTQQAALNLIARSLIAKSLEEGQGLDPTRRAKLQSLLGALKDMGLKDLANIVADTLK